MLREVTISYKDFVVFSDNVAHHTSKTTNKISKKLNTKFIAPVPWKPELNPIEKCFRNLET